MFHFCPVQCTVLRGPVNSFGLFICIVDDFTVSFCVHIISNFIINLDEIQ